MVKLYIKNITQNAFSNADGDVVRVEIKKALSTGTKVEVSFNGFTSVNSSFINSALIKLLNDYSFEFIKSNLTFIDTTKQINHMISSRFKFEVDKLKMMV
ncbi:STAS-like domain-containing protein, partial [Listeria monocytogenes]|uniref:STAS-like domain-containing protein n=1 Tax=Listeria monocytogenes TaxID=1639 RepID=UPI000874662F